MQGYLRSLHDGKGKAAREHRIPVEVYKKIMPCGSRAGVIYGLPKIHKEGTPVRPIISAVKTYNYNLAKWLNEILTPVVDTTHMLKDTYDFVNKISTLDSNVSRYQVSFDVESLFTNVPTKETIDIILDMVYTADVKLFHNLTRNELKKLLIICTQESHFQFNGKFYDQIDGVAMGSPLGPLFANVFMSHFERKHMERMKELGLKTWMRFVDDIHATVGDKGEAIVICMFLNEQHPNIKFTIEHEVKNRLPFLDTCVIRAVNGYKTTVYRKKTFTGVYLNWNSLTARRYKIGLIRCLAERIWRTVSDTCERMAELQRLRTILARNEYPASVIECTLKRFMEKKSCRIEREE